LKLGFFLLLFFLLLYSIRVLFFSPSVDAVKKAVELDNYFNLLIDSM